MHVFIPGVATSSAESFATNNHPVSQADIDPMADFLGGHQNMNENDKIKVTCNIFKSIIKLKLLYSLCKFSVYFRV